MSLVGSKCRVGCEHGRGQRGTYLDFWLRQRLAQQGIATLRFDFTGLGESEGDFGRGGFSSSVADIVAAVHWMQSTIGMPALLVGHSLGGTAAIAAAARLDGIRAVCTLGAPATADHVLRHFGPTKSEEDGQIQVDLGGRAFRIAPAFIEELQAQAHENPVKGLRAALLVMHAPSDAVVDIGEAQDLFKAARHPRVSSAWTMRTICSRARPMRSMRLT